MKKRNSQSITKATPAFVCMAGVDWWYMSHAHSEIQLMSRVARSRRVLFVNSIGMRMPSPSTTTEPSRRIWNKIKSIGHLVQRPMPERPNFWVFSPLSLPFFRSSRGRAINSALVRFQLRVVLFALRMPTPVFIVTLPTAWEVIRHLPRRALIVNKADKFSSQHDVDQAYVAGLEHELLEAADQVCYVSRTLMSEDEAVVGTRGVFLDHGVAIETFTRAGSESIPEDLMTLPRPVIGYFGNLAGHRIDVELLARIASEFPDASLVLIGDIAPAMSRIATLPNVHLLGSRPYDQIPAYGSGFDVAIMPYVQSEWIRNSNPIKMKEYLALGLPIVSTSIPEVSKYTDWLFMTDNDDEFIEKLGLALRGDAPSDPAGRRAAVAEFSWETRADLMIAMAEANNLG